jgi:hypothetical protein
MMVYKLVRLHGDEDWAAWGDRWDDHVDKICDLRFVGGSTPAWMYDRPRVNLDWGAWLYEASLAEVRRLIRSRRSDDPIFREIEEKQNTILDALPADARYGVIWVECY